MHTPSVYRPPSPPDSRSHSHSRSQPIPIPSRGLDSGYPGFGSPLSSVSSLTPSPSPLMLASFPPHGEQSASQPMCDRPCFDRHKHSSSTEDLIVHRRPMLDNLLSPPTVTAAPVTPNEQHASIHRLHKSDGPHTPTKRKPDASFTSPKAPTRVKKVKLTFRQCNTPPHNDVKESQTPYDNSKDTRQPVSRKPSRERFSLDSAEFQSSETEADVPIYALQSPRQEVLCN